MDASTPPRPARHELRLLTITVVVSVVMLLLLARLRFPVERERAAEPIAPAPPLQRLAAQATYDELASILRGLDREVAGSVSIVRVAPDGLDGAADGPAALVPVVRIGAERGVALAGPGRRLVVVPDAAATRVIAFDGPRGVGLLGMAAADVVPLRIAPPDTLGDAPGYVAAIEATSGGPAIRPMYFGRVDLAHDARWGDVLRFSALQQMLPAGAAVFTLDGGFLGAGLPDGREFLVIPAATLIARANAIEHEGSVASADLGIEVQPLNASLREATGADGGVIVTYVVPKGASAGILAAGDVIRAVAGIAVDTPAEYEGAVMRLKPSEAAAIDLLRQGQTATVTVVPAPAGERTAAPAGDLGLELRTVKGAGAEVVRVTPGSVAARAGIAAGDLIDGIGTTDAPSGPVVLRAYRQLADGAAVLTRVQRGSTHLIVALAKP